MYRYVFVVVLYLTTMFTCCKCDRRLVDLCSCQPTNTCSSPSTLPEGSSHIDIRIVTPPVGVQCEAGSVYCCFTEQTPCGVRSGNISSSPVPGAGAGQARFGEFPWQALLLDLDSNYVGSGAIVDRLHIVTAAHKVCNTNPIFFQQLLSSWK